MPDYIPELGLELSWANSATVNRVIFNLSLDMYFIHLYMVRVDNY